MMERISSGENLIGYNIFGSYALLRAKKDPIDRHRLPKDYNLVLSRLIFIAKNAKNPNAARLWVDYILSKRGQTITAEPGRARLGPHRHDGNDPAGFAKELGSAVKPIAVSTDLLQRPRPDQAARIPEAVAGGARRAASDAAALAPRARAVGHDARALQPATVAVRADCASSCCRRCC